MLDELKTVSMISLNRITDISVIFTSQNYVRNILNENSTSQTVITTSQNEVVDICNINSNQSNSAIKCCYALLLRTKSKLTVIDGG